MSEKQLLERLRAINVVEVEAHYDGSGDEGYVDNIECYSLFGSPDVDYRTRMASQVDIGDELRTSVETLVEGLLDARGIDWFNNEGGYGFCTINVVTGETDINHYQRVDHYEPFSATIGGGVVNE